MEKKTIVLGGIFILGLLMATINYFLAKRTITGWWWFFAIAGFVAGIALCFVPNKKKPVEEPKEEERQAEDIAVVESKEELLDIKPAEEKKE